jgi:ORF6N domain
MAKSKEEAASLELVTTPSIEKRIFVVRDRQVMLDEDLADLYDVETRVLVQQVKRNAKRFPPDFMFQLTKAEVEALRSQIVTSKLGRGGRRYAPYVFTEQGVAMLSGVLRSDRAIAVNIEIMRTFVELRRVARSYAALQERLEELEREMTGRLDQHDEQLEQIFKALHRLIEPPPRPQRPVGFRVRKEDPNQNLVRTATQNVRKRRRMTIVLGPNGSLYPWIAPLVFAMLGAALLAKGSYLAAALFVVAAVLIRWLHQIAIDRGEDP